jgi:hypothetical protein
MVLLYQFFKTVLKGMAWKQTKEKLSAPGDRNRRNMDLGWERQLQRTSEQGSSDSKSTINRIPTVVSIVYGVKSGS